MAAYAALVSVKASFTRFLHYADAALPPEILDISKRALKESTRFMDYLERLSSSSRKRVSHPLGRVVEAVQAFTIWFKFDDDDDDDDAAWDHISSLLDTLKKMHEECCSLLEDEEEDVSSSSSSSSSKMIGLRDERRKLKEALFDYHYLKKPVFLLAGMAGIGKTTLAREIYEDLNVSEWFDCRAWVTLGDEWKSKDITEAILGQVDPDAHKMVMGGDEEEIAQWLKESLKLGNRSLIVVDDVWDYNVFPDYMERLLLHNAETSRVVLISRITDSRFTDQWYVFDKRLLNKEESWNLLREKVFGGGTCPPKLEETGKKIAEKCEGLPLTIVTVADLLSKVDRESLWIDIAEKKRHQLFTNAYDQISKVLYPSYKALRDELKLCFLYIGVFPLKHEIHRSKLINLWTAEELFNQFEEVSSPYLTFLRSIMHLDECSLIMVHKRSTTYSLLHWSRQAIRICGLHSSWWHFCQREARKIKFFHVLVCPEDGLEEGIKGHSRLSIHNNVLFARKDVYKSIEENCASSAQSLLCFGPYNQYMVPMCFGLKFLQRLDALNIRFYDFPLEVLELAELIYLALTCNRQLPPSISKLERLQYLIVHPHLSIKSSGLPSYMPMEIWDLEDLKYLQVLGSDLPDPGDKSLRMLSTLLDVSTASCTVLSRLPKLEKLRIRIELTPEARDPLCCFDHIIDLMEIKELTCIVVNPGFQFQVVRSVASFPVLPSSLKKLSLSGLGYPWEEMRGIASLEGLQVLKLQFNAFHGQIWEVKELDFPDLRFLLIEGLDLVKLKMKPGSCFSRLQHLSIKHCYKLEKIQLKNCEVSRIEVVDSNPLVEKSIKKNLLEKVQLPEHLLVHYSWKSE